MKKLAIFLAMMLIPFSAFALDTITDNDLNDVTGQAGVSIYTNSIHIVKTGVTTSYTDDAQSVTVVADSTDTKIFFGGVDPIMIDIIEMNTLDTLLTACGYTLDSNDYGDTAVQITLPDSIQIQNLGSVKSYYSGDVSNLTQRNRFITVTTTGGTTIIDHADQGFSAPFTSIGSCTGLRHDDQIKILISAHEGDG